ncbi:MAG TPA: 4a-hydroxytetrahydrobiopterin dehydratase [Promineifilum sp.]|nr:4a-hydroxytetrahydrobiopterin dehydratase [Promineifilum sp.]HRQ12924.1 4a-hydroxytetrahydrobiopterin dehydratase [Promineifilum sp.]
MTHKKLDDDEIRQALAQLPGWSVVDGKLHKEFKFGSFAEAIGWMVSVAIFADKIDHHPEWLNVYNRVRVNLMTHDLDDAISDLDIEMARKMNTIAGQG